MRPESAPQFETILETNRQGVLGIDLQGRCTFINAAAAEMLGVDPEQAVGRELEWAVRLGRNESLSSSAASHPAAAPPLPFPFPAKAVDGEGLALGNGKAARLERGMLWRRDGMAFPAEYSHFPVIEDGVIQGMVMTFVNTLERERLEQQFRQAQKMEAIGRLAGGIAHDFNNLLTAILGYSELMRAGISNCNPLYHEIVEINKAAQRAAGLTSQLLSFSRRKPVNRQCLDLNILLADMEGMVRRLLGEDVKLSMALDPSLTCIQADQGQIEQVVLNLAVNARDAMPRGGQLTLITANVELNGTEANERRQFPERRAPSSLPGGEPQVTDGIGTGSYIMLAAKDTGCGMDEETRGRIFEPFFTTKESSTGLGLATVLGIVRENNGFIDVASQVGDGTIFRIYFPRLPDVSETIKAVSPQPAARGGAETVLLVEDEETLRDLIQSILRRYGYHVLKAPSAMEALLIGQRHPEPIDLLLTDLIMPHMTGRQLAEQLAPLRPKMKVLYMSGSTDDTAARYGVTPKDIALIRKPFTPSALARRMRGLLDQGENGSG